MHYDSIGAVRSAEDATALPPSEGEAAPRVRGYTPEQLDTAIYIEELATELGRLAKAQGLRHLVMFTWQTAYEAHSIATGEQLTKAAFDRRFYV
jgi:hypothetical protein